MVLFLLEDVSVILLRVIVLGVLKIFMESSLRYFFVWLGIRLVGLIRGVGFGVFLVYRWKGVSGI